MALGPGKYDDLCTHVRVSTEAEAVILLVMGGDRGTGFSVQVTNRVMSNAELAMVLRGVCDSLDPPQ